MKETDVKTDRVFCARPALLCCSLTIIVTINDQQILPNSSLHLICTLTYSKNQIKDNKKSQKTTQQSSGRHSPVLPLQTLETQKGLKHPGNNSLCLTGVSRRFENRRNTQNTPVPTLFYKIPDKPPSHIILIMEG